MSKLVQIQGETPHFPGHACVHCLSPATEMVELIKVKDNGSVRRIDVPFCADCVALRRAKTTRQVQVEKTGLIGSVVLGLMVGLWAFVRTLGLGRWAWGILLGLLTALIVFGVLYMVVQVWARGLQSAETKAALRAVSIREFDWDTTVLEFQNEEYAERFAQLNAPRPPTASR